MSKDKGSASRTINTIRRKTQRKYSAEKKIRIVLEGLRGEVSVAELCRREGIAESVYYRWSKECIHRVLPHHPQIDLSVSTLAMRAG